MTKLFTLALSAAAPLVLSTSVQAAIIASDDFSAMGSGTGWLEGSFWGDAVNNGVATFGNVNRNFAQPVNPVSLGTIYIAFDFAVTSGDGGAWGGAAFFEGTSAGGTETFFMGDPGSIPNFGLDMKGPGAVDSGRTIITGETVRFITEISFNVNGGSDDLYRIWVDGVDLNAPTAVSSLVSSPISSWQSLRLAADGSRQNTVDNLVIATTPQEVGLIPEPGSVGLLAIGGLLLGTARRRKKA